MIKINVLVSNNAWKKYLKNPETYLKKRIKKIESKYRLFKKKKLFFSIMLSGNEKIKKLNKQFRNKNKTTDILSFPFHKKKDLDKLIKSKQKQIYLGDIIINVNKISNNLNKKIFLEKFDIIWIHGLTHLLGYKHKLNYDYLIMNRFEKRLLKILS